MITNGVYTYGTQNIILKTFGESAILKIGKFCSIARNVTVYLGGDHRTDWITTFPFGHIHEKDFPYHGKGHPKTNGNVVIENDVWIGENVVIMSGVKISSGAVIANNSHVVKDVPPYSIYGGNPAKLIRKRFNDFTIDKLLEFAWWDKPNEEINKIIPLLCSDNIVELLAKIEKR